MRDADIRGAYAVSPGAESVMRAFADDSDAALSERLATDARNIAGEVALVLDQLQRDPAHAAVTASAVQLRLDKVAGVMRLLIDRKNARPR